MRKNPKISFLVCTRNRSHVVEECISNLLNSSRDDIEIIVRDNCSTDHTNEILQKFQDKRLKTYRAPENQGTRNFFEIAKYATGEIVTWLSDEDDFEFQNLDYILSQFEETSCSVIFGGIIVGKAQSEVLFDEAHIQDPVNAYLLAMRFSGCGGVFIRRKALGKLLALQIHNDDSAYFYWNYYPIGFFATYSIQKFCIKTTKRILIRQARHAQTNNNWSLPSAKQNRLPHYYPQSVYDRLIGHICVLIRSDLNKNDKIKSIYSLIRGFYAHTTTYKSSNFITLLMQNYDKEIVDKYIKHIEKLNLDSSFSRYWYCLKSTIIMPISFARKNRQWNRMQKR